jgi:predicted NUDIX family NTP pyrophosphohydrolase
MAKRATVSAGLLLYRRLGDELEVFLAHPGGPFWAHRDAGAWSIPKGLVDAGEAPLAAACREFEEETGIRPKGPFLSLERVMHFRFDDATLAVWHTPHLPVRPCNDVQSLSQ